MTSNSTLLYNRLVVRKQEDAIYAIVEASGKQYRVAAGDLIDVDIPAQEGDTLELDRVLMVADGDKVTVGTPTLPGAKVIASVVERGKGKKIVVLKFKSKVRYHKRQGHRQSYTRLQVKEIKLAP